MQQPVRLSFRLSDLRTAVCDSPKLVAAVLLAALIPLAGCGTASPPTRQADICEVFRQYPDWYDYARKSASRWEHRSTCRCRSCATNRVIGATPGRRANGSGSNRSGRPSSAKGYAQAQDPVWNEYQAERGRLFRSRGDMEDALDFIGWYNHRTRRQLGIPLTDAQRLYLAYHEGQGGYRRGTWRDKPKVQRAARRVAATSDRYRAQLVRCESSFRCDSWYQVWPFCR